METFFLIGKIAGTIASIWGGFKVVPKIYGWARKWTIVKRTDLERLKALEAKGPDILPNPLETLRTNYGDEEYLCLDFLWILRTDFWLNCERLPVTAAGDSFLETAVLGPLCPECKRELSANIVRGQYTCICSRKFSIGDIGNTRFPVSVLRRAVYTEAQAAVRRKELTPTKDDNNA
jgi:hypothetical protein